VLGTDAVDSRLLGGKGASLDRLARLGFTVPPGVCLTTAAFHAHLGAIADRAALTRATAALPAESARATLVALVGGSPLAPSVQEALADAIDRLVATAPAPLRVAVRSSAIDEDGAVASFAGLHDTELGVAPGDIEGAVRRCWASLWNAQAVAYRLRRQVSLQDLGMAVVVQALVPADAAAVVFTRHPVTGRDDQVLINAIPGLGEPMVAGTVTPDTIVVDKASRAVVSFTVGVAPEVLVALESGVARQANPPGGRALDDIALRELVTLACEVERRFGANVDLEAARSGGRWYLLQARPITTH
jgi:phosphoenolpyruvate synthase/pyruvate phosphate dikinase